MACPSFCPHLTFRLPFRKYNISCSGGLAHNSFHKSKHSGRKFIPSVGGDVGSGDGMYESSSCKAPDEKGTDSCATPLSELCDMCDPAENVPNSAQWQCLDSRCGLILCGASSHNHSQYHFEDFPSHMLQENIVTKRIWCNECQHEVFLPLWRNRRLAPAVWVPPDGSDDEPPRGLYNIGNTCFMNSALQCMTAVTPLNSYFMGYCCSLAGRPVGSGYLWLLSEMWSDQQGGYQKGVMPSRLLHSVRTAHPIFRGFHQHDTQEFLRLFMDSLTEETRVPHYVFDNEKKLSPSDEASTSSDSETDSFETCDSGNGSEEAGSLISADQINMSTTPKNICEREYRNVKVLMKSIVSDIFDGRVESSVQCLSCKQLSRRLEVFQDLSLPIPTKEELMSLKIADKFENEEIPPSNSWVTWVWDWVKSFFIGPTPTLEDCFAAFFSSDELKGKNMYSCEKCKKLRNGVKRCFLYELPEVLCVHLKRFRLFEYGGGMGFSGKVSQYVQFPLDELDLKPFLHSDCRNTVTNYRLLGTIVHMGSFTGGHYIAYVRRGDQWYVCDDSRVVAVSPETVAESEVYVLFYQKWNEEEDFTKQSVLQEWGNKDNSPDKDDRYHLLSRKWLTNFCWGEESGPIDNSDVVCPHGRFAPSETVHLAGTWIPHSVWEIIYKRFGGGPDLVDQSECAACTEAWKRQQKLMQKSKNTPEPPLSISGNSATSLPFMIPTNSFVSSTSISSHNNSLPSQ